MLKELGGILPPDTDGTEVLNNRPLGQSRQEAIAGVGPSSSGDQYNESPDDLHPPLNSNIQWINEADEVC